MHIQIIYDFEEAFLEKFIFGKFIGLDFQLFTHDFCQFVDEDLVAFELNILISLDSLILGRIKEIEGGYCVGIEPQDDGEREFRKRDCENDGIRDELDHIDLDPLAFCQLEPSKFVVLFSFIQVD